MKIEDAIKQKKQFKTEYERVLVNILYTASLFEGMNIQRLKPHGISPQQYNVLRILRGSHPQPCSLGQVTERMIDKNSNATRLVEKLRLKGLVLREICMNNRRQVDIKITHKGLELLSEIDKETENWFAAPKSISSEELVQLSLLLDKLRE